MNTELKQALEVIKKHTSQPKGKSWRERMDGASLKQRIETLNSELLHYVDHQTIWYCHHQIAQKQPGHFEDHPNYMKVELSKRQKEDCLDALKRMNRDLEACIGHLEY